MKTEPKRTTLCSIAMMFLIACVSLSAQPQSESATSQIEVLKIKWERQARLPQDFDPSGGGASGTINDPTRNSRGSGSSGGGDSSGTTLGLQPVGPSRVSFSYVYSMKIQNHGSKEIEGVAWDYIFLDPSTSAEVGRHQFLSFERVEASRTATFHSEQRTPPVRTLSADANKKLAEKPLIRCVLYADGSTWREANTGDDVCNLLKKGKAALSHKRSA
jgi:hypothetical protein